MEQLIQITTTPMKYEMVLESAKLEYKQEFQPEIQIDSQRGNFEMQTTPTKMYLDTYEQRRSVGLSNNSDFVQDTANAGKRNISNYISNTNQMGQQMAQIEDNVTIGSIMEQKLTQAPAMMSTVFIPSGRVRTTWQPGNVETNYRQGKVNFNFNMKDVEFEYSPPSAKINILSHASVDIEYIAGPTYVPRSADPDYVEPVE